MPELPAGRFRPSFLDQLKPRERDVLETVWLFSIAMGRTKVRFTRALLQRACKSYGKDFASVLDDLVRKHALLITTVDGVTAEFRLLDLAASKVAERWSAAEWRRILADVEELNGGEQVPLDLPTEQASLAEVMADAAPPAKEGRSAAEWLLAMKAALDNPEAFPEIREVPKFGRADARNSGGPKAQQNAPPEIREAARIRNVLDVERCTSNTYTLAPPEIRELLPEVRALVGEKDFCDHWLDRKTGEIHLGNIRKIEGFEKELAAAVYAMRVDIRDNVAVKRTMGAKLWDDFNRRKRQAIEQRCRAAAKTLALEQAASVGEKAV